MVSKFYGQELYTHDGHAFCAHSYLSSKRALRLAEVKSWALGLASCMLCCIGVGARMLVVRVADVQDTLSMRIA